ncbi:MAG: DUF302 domain-containing protein [Flavobacteriaceae bacterium]|nr:DUF302 domain-containing protein [Flavobacteriaceae bacterium]
MNYYFNKTVLGSFDDIIEKVKVLLKEEGFGVLTEINIQDTFKEKLNVDFKQYKILGACNPHFAYKALQAENKIGVMLPCNIIVQETKKNTIEVAAVNPLVSMQAIKNPELDEIAQSVSQKLENVVNRL